MSQVDHLERLHAMHGELREAQLKRYRQLLSIRPELREAYMRWEEQLIAADVCRPGALIGFWGHETHSPLQTAPVLWFGHLLSTFSFEESDETIPIIDGVGVNMAAEILLEGGHEIRFVPLGLITFLAIPLLDGKWHIAVRPEFETLFTTEPSFGSLPSWAFHALDPASDFQDPALSSLQHLGVIHGREAIADARRVKAIMRDLAPQPAWCASVMAQAVELGIFERLLSQSVSYSLIRPDLIAKLHENGPSQERAQWAIDRLAVIAGKYTALELSWDWFSKWETNSTFWAFRWRPQKAHTHAETITDCTTAYIVPLGDCERTSPEQWPVDVPTPKQVDPSAELTHDNIRDFVVVRVRDNTHRLLFSYLFENKEAAFAATRSLHAFHENRRKLLDWAKCLVTELDPNQHASLAAILASASSELPAVIGFYRRGDEAWGRDSLVSVFYEVAPKFAGRCRFHSMAVSDELLEERFDYALHKGFSATPWVAAFHYGAFLIGDSGEISAESIRRITESALSQSHALEESPQCHEWRFRDAEQFNEPNVIRTAVPDHPEEFLLDSLASDALSSDDGTLYGLLTSSRTIEKNTITTLCSSLAQLTQPVSVIYAPTDADIWQNVTPFPVAEVPTVYFKIRALGEWGGGVLAFVESRQIAAGDMDFVELAKGRVDTSWGVVSPCMSSEQLRRCVESDYTDEATTALAKRELRSRHEAAVIDQCFTLPEFGSLMFSKPGASWKQLRLHIKNSEEPKMILFCRDEDEWRRIVAEGDLTAGLDIVVFTDETSLLWELHEAFDQFNYTPDEAPVLVAFDQKPIDCLAKCYKPAYGHGCWVEQVEKIYEGASPFRKWRGGTLMELDELVDSLQSHLPTQADERAEEELWERQLREAGTWNEYNRKKLGIVDEWLRTKAIKRGLDRQAWTAEATVGAYFARHLPKLRAQIEG
jgi:hypothetical protein